MAVRWLVAYALSYRDVEELMNERGVKVDHATIQCWVVEYSPELMEQARKVMQPSADSWRMGETTIKVKGEGGDGHPGPNRKALYEFIVFGLKYVFLAKPGAIERGVATAFAAPVLKEELRSAGDFIFVWPDAQGKDKGQRHRRGWRWETPGPLVQKTISGVGYSLFSS